MALNLLSGESHVLDFGKHKGKTVKQVMDIEASYLIWAHEKTDKLFLKDEVLRKAKREAEAQKKDHFDTYGHDWDWGQM